MRHLGTLLALTLVVALAAGGGCGGSGLSQAYSGYKQQVEPALEKEAELWNRLGAIVRGETTDAALNRYYEYLDQTALPFYTQLHADVGGLELGHEGLAAAHDELVSFAEARLEFVHGELRSRAMKERARSAEGGLMVLFEQEGFANAETSAYLRLVADTAPDSKLGELNQVVEHFRERWFVPMQAGEKDPSEVERRVRNHVLPRIREIRQKRFGDDPASRQLKRVVAAWETWHTTFADACPLYSDLVKTQKESDATLRRAEQHLTDFRALLKKVREQR